MHSAAQENRNRGKRDAISKHIFSTISSSGIFNKADNGGRRGKEKLPSGLDGAGTIKLTYLLSRVLDLWKWEDVIWRDMFAAAAAAAAAAALYPSHPRSRGTLEILKFFLFWVFVS